MKGYVVNLDRRELDYIIDALIEYKHEYLYEDDFEFAGKLIKTLENLRPIVSGSAYAEQQEKESER